MLFIKICVILSSIFLIVEASLFGGLFGGKEKKEEASHVAGSADRQKEIDAIRKEINSSNDPPPGIVVQPEWLHKSDSSAAVVSTKDKMSAKNMDEAASIRDEINTAVKNNQYVEGNAEAVAAADKLLGAEFRMKNLISSKSAPSVGGGIEDEESDEEIESTFIDSFHTFEDKLRYRNRDMLYIKSIDNMNFSYGIGVEEWHFLVENKSEVLVGVKEKEIVQIIDFQEQYNFPLNESVKQVETINLLNKTTLEMKGYILILTNNNIQWYHIKDDVSFWSWSLGSKKDIKAIKYFSLEETHFLALILGSNVIYVYSFDLLTEDFQIAQKLTVSMDIKGLCILNTGRDVIIAPTPENSTSLEIFKFELQYFENGRFKFERLKTLTFETNVEGVFDFRMGGNYYLATSGMSPKIYMYSDGDFNATTEFSSEIGTVQTYLPIPIMTFRDDLILLVQHVTEFETHSIVDVNSMVWDGKTFIPTLPPPCKVNNKTVHSGINCILDIARDQGIIGASMIYEINGNISLIVPRKNATAGLHRVNAGYMERNTETLELKEIFTFLRASFYAQMKIIEEGYLFIEENLVLPDKIKARTVEIDGDESEIGHIFINQDEWTEEDDQVDLLKLADMIEIFHNDIKLLEDVAENSTSRRKREAPLQFDEMEFDFVEVTDELILMDPGNSSFEADRLEIDGDLSVKNINDKDWKEFEKTIIRMDRNDTLENLVVDGDVIFENELIVENLNDKSLENEYLWSNIESFETVKVSGLKRFENILTNDIDTDGFINGVRPSDFISLSGNQTIHGKTVFTNQLEVTEELLLKGTVHGRGLEDFLSNDDLRTTRIIKSKCQFNSIEVNGPVTISKNFNGINLDNIFQNIILKSNSSEIIEINSSKTFESLTAPKVVVESGELNNIPLENFVSKTRPQELQITNFKGIIVTNFLDIKGLVDGVNPKEFFEDCVYTNDSNSDIHLNITAIFEEDVEADEFQVLKIFNNRPVHDLITTDNLTDHFEKFTFQKLRVDTMDCECDVEGVGILNGVDIRTVKARSFKAPAHPQHLYVDHLVLRKGLNVSRINTIPVETITKYLDSLQDLPQMLKSGRVSVDTIVVKGSVNVNLINGKEFNPDDFIWLNRENVVKNHLEFKDPLHFEKNMYINGQLNDDSQTFPEFISQIAFKTEDYIQLRGKSEFLYEVLCHDNIFVEEMNGIPFSDIAMKTTPIEFAEDLEIHGNLHVNNLVVKENLNNHSIAELPHLCRFDNYLNTWVFGGPLLFKGHVEIENLILRSSVNDVDDMEELLNSLTYINQISVLKGKTIFKNEVSINKGGFIKHLNGFDLMDVLNNMVFISGSHQVKISGPVVFQGPVKATHVTIKSGLISENINDCDVGEWVEDSVKINEDIKLNGTIKFKESTLDGNSLYIETLNGCPFENFLTLHTPQNFSGNFDFSTVYVRESLSVGRMLNGLDVKNLPYERNNTLMKNYQGYQQIENTLTIPNHFTVLENLNIETGNININKKLDEFLSLDGNIEINSPVWIGNISVKDVHTLDFISGIDIMDWAEKSLLRNKNEQIVTGKWTFDNLETVMITGNYTINEIPMNQFLIDLREKKLKSKLELTEVLEKMRSQCRRKKHSKKFWSELCGYL